MRDDHHVRLFFKSSAGVSAGAVINVTVVGTPNASCTAAATPAPVTVAWATDDRDAGDVG